MENKKQYLRDIKPGDVSIEGRKSNGITADINGNTIIYAGIKQNELQKLNQEQYVGNVPIDGYTSTFIAALSPGQLPPFPEGNNNNETYFDNNNIDPNKIVTTSQTPPTPSPSPSVPVPPSPSSLPTKENNIPPPSPTYDEDFEFTTSPGLTQASAQLTTSSLDIDLGLSPTIIINGVNETNVVSGKIDYSNITIIKLGSVTYKNNRTIDVGSKPNEFLPRNSNGDIAPYYNFLAAAKASIGTYTKTLKGTESKDRDGNPIPDTGGALGCGGGVAIIYLRATGHGMRWDLNSNTPPKPGDKVSLDLGTATISSYMSKDKKNWRVRSNWRNAQPGDCLITVTLTQGKNGHIGWVSDTKFNDLRTFTYDVISNSSSGYNGTVTNRNLAGSIQNNYSIRSWGETVANRNGVGPTYAYEFIGEFGKTI